MWDSKRPPFTQYWMQKPFITVANQNNSLKQLFIKQKPVVVGLSILATTLTVFIVIWLNLSWRPDISSLPPDSGFYAYYGKAILQGQIPYRDLWDNKPPLGYYLNALALLVFGQTPWGIWWSSVVWITGCIVLFFLVIKKLLGGITAGISSIIFLVALMNPEIFQGGNLMEVYSLLPQISIIGVTFLFFIKKQRALLAVLVGVLTACAFLIKQPTIILGCSSILMMTLYSLSKRKFRDTFRLVVGFLLGFLSLVAVVSVYWLWIGAFGNLIDGAFLQGIALIGGTESHFRENFFYALVNVIPNLDIGRLYIIALLAAGFFLVEKLYEFWLKPVFKTHLPIYEWCLLILFAVVPLVGKWFWPKSYFGKFWLISIFAFGLYFLIKFYLLKPKPVYQNVFSPIEWAWLIAVVSLPLEVLMVSLGGRYLGHYFITMIPAVMVTISYPIWKVGLASRGFIKSKSGLFYYAANVILAFSTMVWGITSVVQDLPSAEYRNDLVGIIKGQFLINDLEQYIIQTTKSDDEVLVWHIHLGINFVTDRKAPARFLYPLNLFIPPSEQNTKLEEYVNELESNPPELIVIQRVSSISLPFVNEPIDQICKPWCTTEFEQAIKVPQILQEWLRFQQFFVTHYNEEARIYDWIVYRKLP